MKKLIALALSFVMLGSVCNEALAAVMTLPKKVQTIDERAFYGDTSMDEVVMPYGSENIGELAFAYSGLKRITIPNTVSYIADNAFEGITGLTIAAPAGSKAQEYAEAEAQTARGFTWEDTGNKYRTETQENLLAMLDGADEMTSLAMDDGEQTLLSAENETNLDRIAFVARYNELQLEIQQTQDEYTKRLEALIGSVNDLGSEIESFELIDQNGSIGLQSDILSYSVNANAYDLTDYEVVSTEETDDGIQVELRSNGEIVYLCLDEDGASISGKAKGRGVTSRGTEGLLKPRAIDSTVIEKFRGFVNAINLAGKGIQDAIDDVVDAAQKDYSAKVARETEVFYFYQQYQYDTPIDSAAIREMEKASREADKAKQRLKIAKQVDRTFRSLNIFATTSQCIIDLERIKQLNDILAHDHPTAQEIQDAQTFEAVKKMLKDLAVARTALLGSIGCGIVDIITEIGSWVMAAEVAFSGATMGTGLVFAMITKLSLTAIKQYAIHWAKSNAIPLIVGMTADAMYERVIKADALLHCVMAGYVVDADTKQKIPEAIITLNEKQYEADKNGFYSIKVDPGVYRVYVSADGYKSGWRTLSAKLNQTTIKDIEMYPTGSISGYVKDIETKLPIQGAVVDFAGLTNDTTDKNGFYQLEDCMVATASLSVTADGYQEDRNLFTVVKNQTTTHDVFLKPAKGTLSGTVKDEKTKEPIEGAIVTCGDEIKPTDANGHYEMTLKTGSYTVLCSKEGYHTNPLTDVYVTLNGNTVRDFWMTPMNTGTITGTVVDESGAALSGVTVTCGDKTVPTDSQGRFELEAPAGGATVRFSKNGYSAEPITCEVSGSGTTSLGTIRMKKTDEEDDDEIVGSTVYFGRYEQDNDLTNGKERIQWRILARDGDYALLLSEYGLDAQPYYTEYVDITWAQCTLRSWLNGTFMSAAFNASEQAAIRTTLVDNSQSQGYAALPGFTDSHSVTTTGGANTQDKVFLLSVAEAYRYLGGVYRDGDWGEWWYVNNGMTTPTAYAKAQGTWTYNNSSYPEFVGNCSWWLRSPGDYYQSYAATVNYAGTLVDYANVNYSDYAVRPALWVNLNSGIF